MFVCMCVCFCIFESACWCVLAERDSSTVHDARDTTRHTLLSCWHRALAECHSENSCRYFGTFGNDWRPNLPYDGQEESLYTAVPLFTNANTHEPLQDLVVLLVQRDPWLLGRTFVHAQGLGALVSVAAQSRITNPTLAKSCFGVLEQLVDVSAEIAVGLVEIDSAVMLLAVCANIGNAALMVAARHTMVATLDVLVAAHADQLVRLGPRHQIALNVLEIALDEVTSEALLTQMHAARASAQTIDAAAMFANYFTDTEFYRRCVAMARERTHAPTGSSHPAGAPARDSLSTTDHGQDHHGPEQRDGSEPDPGPEQSDGAVATATAAEDTAGSDCRTDTRAHHPMDKGGTTGTHARQPAPTPSLHTGAATVRALGTQAVPSRACVGCGKIETDEPHKICGVGFARQNTPPAPHCLLLCTTGSPQLLLPNPLCPSNPYLTPQLCIRSPKFNRYSSY
eukprot:m.751158 g.751158  ORF g.751158 m.751158 type:complete len:454 (+) comp23165_c0_seq2:1364-2725(+)